jgi:hypothetical protein
MIGQVDYNQLDVAGKMDLLTRAIRNLTDSMTLAKQAGNQAAVDGLRTQFLNVSALLKGLRVQASAADMPSDFMRSLDAFADQTVATGKSLFGVVADVGAGLGATAKTLPLLLIAALAVLGIVGVGYVKHGGVRVRTT